MHEWTTTERRRLGELLDQGLTYAQAAEAMVLPLESIKGAARRYGFTGPHRRGWHARNWSAIDPLIIDCIERGLSMKQAVAHLKGLGLVISYNGVWSRVCQMPEEVRDEARANGRRRISTNAHRMRLRIKRAA
ncbi:hypothetical protein ACGTNG_12765 [Halomonas sp. 1390]|uniref:hypothetical protein n=1 Tax=Halomonas sp. B23F22_3 TaxID=3459516 RepID=UPI00373EBFBE